MMLLVAEAWFLPRRVLGYGHFVENSAFAPDRIFNHSAPRRMALNKKLYFPIMRYALLLSIVLSSLSPAAQVIERSEEGHEMMRIFYGGGSYYLDNGQGTALKEWLSSVENLHEYEIVVRSHTDNIGSRSYNQYLSEMRSESVIRAMGEIDIHREEIRVEDYGEDHPTFSNETLQGRLNNRRVDVILRPPST